MTDKESFADGVRDPATADDSSHAHQVPERYRWANFLRDYRW